MNLQQLFKEVFLELYWARLFPEARRRQSYCRKGDCCKDCISGCNLGLLGGLVLSHRFEVELQLAFVKKIKLLEQNLRKEQAEKGCGVDTAAKLYADVAEVLELFQIVEALHAFDS